MSIGDRYHFHRDCIHYEKCIKEPAPRPRHKGAIRVKCPAKKYAQLYYCESDFENIKDDCGCFQPKVVEVTIMDYIRKE